MIRDQPGVDGRGPYRDLSRGAQSFWRIGVLLVGLPCW